MYELVLELGGEPAALVGSGSMADIRYCGPNISFTANLHVDYRAPMRADAAYSTNASYAVNTVYR